MCSLFNLMHFLREFEFMFAFKRLSITVFWSYFCPHVFCRLVSSVHPPPVRINQKFLWNKYQNLIRYFRRMTKTVSLKETFQMNLLLTHLKWLIPLSSHYRVENLSIRTISR